VPAIWPDALPLSVAVVPASFGTMAVSVAPATPKADQFAGINVERLGEAPEHAYGIIMSGAMIDQPSSGGVVRK